jgi:tungstate transport system substrate-binding protein
VRRVFAYILLVLAAAAVAAYITHRGGSVVRLQVTTTTSLYATGLLDMLAEEFAKTHPGVRIEFIAVGSGEALRRAANGDACMVFVHAPSLEKKYIEEGVLRDHRIIAYNFFAIVGPRDDPAGVRGSASAVEAFRKIYEAGEKDAAKFVSRGDNSGTHVRELMLWKLAGLNPEGRPWYIVSGQGMAKTLVMADELGAYTLSDTGTFLKLSLDGRIPGLSLLYTNSSELINVYSVYLVSSCSGEQLAAAKAFALFVSSPAGQKLIASYGVEKYGQPLFYPALGHEEMLKKAWDMLANES